MRGITVVKIILLSMLFFFIQMPHKNVKPIFMSQANYYYSSSLRRTLVHFRDLPPYPYSKGTEKRTKVLAREQVTVVAEAELSADEHCKAATIATPGKNYRTVNNELSKKGITLNWTKIKTVSVRILQRNTKQTKRTSTSFFFSYLVEL